MPWIPPQCGGLGDEEEPAEGLENKQLGRQEDHQATEPKRLVFVTCCC